MTMTSQKIIEYYSGLLILQYKNLPNAKASVEATVSPVILPETMTEAISFSLQPVSGTFILNYGAQATGAIAWNASAATIQTALRLLTGLESVLVTGSIAALVLVVAFVGDSPATYNFVVTANSLLASGGGAVAVRVTDTVWTDTSLPLSVQSAFNIDTAVGDQLDKLAKYVGVSRSVLAFSGQVTLNDNDLRILVKMKSIQNNSGSALADIQNLIFKYFAGALRVFDTQNMQMSYFFNSSGSIQLAQVFVRQSLLPKPMGVQLSSLIYIPSVQNSFGFRTYDLPGFQVKGFNNYASYDSASPWLNYSNVITF